MEKELDPSIIKATQTSLGKYVKRPQLSEKLLKKPPFRFLHDIITTVLKTTGFFEGLFEKDELVSENVKDRESKVLFLNKVISVVGLTTGKSLSVKPSKIVAGQEPEKTNELLQCLAQALENKLSSVEAVKKYKEEAKPSQKTDSKEKEPPKATKKSTDPKKITSRSSEKLTSQNSKEKDGPTAKNGDKVSKSKDKAGATVKPEAQLKTTLAKSKIINKKTQVENAHHAPSSNSNANNQSTKLSVKDTPLINKDENNKSHVQEESNIGLPNPHVNIPSDQDEVAHEKLNSSYTIIAENDFNSSNLSQSIESNFKDDESQLRSNNSGPFGDAVIAGEKEYQDEKIKENDKITDEKKEESNEKKVDIIPNSSLVGKDNAVKDTEIKPQDRIKTAKTTEPVSNVLRPPSVRPSSSRPGAPRFRDKQLATEQGTENLLMGKVNIIVENTPNEEEEDSSIIIVEQQTDHNASLNQSEQLVSNEHGHLVQQILDSQKEFSQVNGKTEIEWQFGAQKAREASTQEIEQIRFNIQALSRAANPLGKLLDHIQEDVEVMRQELQQWTKAYEETSKELLRLKAANDESLMPLHTRIKQLDADIKEKQDKIDDLKIVIYKNSTRIDKLLASGSVQ